MPSKIRGVTLLEILLVMAVGIVILMFSIRQYQNFRTDAEFKEVQNNVNVLFQAMANYYKAECYGTVNKEGKLNPDKGPPINFPVSLTDMQGYLTGPLIQNTIWNNNNIVMQFNQQSSKRKVCLDNSCDNQVTIATIIYWQSQIAMKLPNNANANMYLAVLGGNCLSGGGGSTVSPCVPNQKGGGQYIVWQQAPSISAIESANTEGNSLVSQFTQMYTTYPILYLISTGGKVEGGGNQYMYCGP